MQRCQFCKNTGTTRSGALLRAMSVESLENVFSEMFERKGNGKERVLSARYKGRMRLVIFMLERNFAPRRFRNSGKCCPSLERATEFQEMNDGTVFQTTCHAFALLFQVSVNLLSICETMKGNYRCTTPPLLLHFLR